MRMKRRGVELRIVVEGKNDLSQIQLVARVQRCTQNYPAATAKGPLESCSQSPSRRARNPGDSARSLPTLARSWDRPRPARIGTSYTSTFIGSCPSCNGAGSFAANTRD
jgi:hypothetical protein